MEPVRLRPLQEADLPVVGRWLRMPHVQAWWRDPSGASDVEARYLPAIRGDDPTEMFVLRWAGRDAGLLQRYRIADHPDWLATLRRVGLPGQAAAGIDYLVGEPDLVGRGVGSAAVAAFTMDTFVRYDDVDAILVTPQLANPASYRVLEKAGYLRIWTGMLDSDDPSDADVAAAYLIDRARACSVNRVDTGEQLDHP